MNILLEVVVQIIIMLLMLKYMDLLDNNKYKVIAVVIISAVINYTVFSMNPMENLWGKIIYYLINILIFTGLCKNIKEGLFYGICFYTIQSIFSIIGLYVNLYVTTQFYQLMTYLTIVLSSILSIIAKRVNIISYKKNNMFLYFIINSIALCSAVVFNYYMSINYQLMPDIYYIGFIILGIWVVLNTALSYRIK